MEQALAASGVEPARTLEIGSTEAIKQLVAAGLGISIVSRAGIKDQVALNRLKTIAVSGLYIERTLWKLKIPGRIDVPAAAAFERLIANAGKNDLVLSIGITDVSRSRAGKKRALSQ